VGHRRPPQARRSGALPHGSRDRTRTYAGRGDRHYECLLTLDRRPVLITRPPRGPGRGPGYFLDYSSSPQEAAQRLSPLTWEAIRRMSALPNAREHLIILVGMAGSVSPPPPTSTARLASKAVSAAIGPRARPTALVFRIRRAVSLARGRHTPRHGNHVSDWPPSPRQPAWSFSTEANELSRCS
jgi:hypothetical protein